MHPVAQGMRRFFATLALLACTQVQAQEIVRIGDLGITADAPFYIAAEKGWFREVGIDARLEKFGSLTEAMAPLSTGELHVLGGGISAALFNAFARGWPVRIAMGRTRDVPGFSSNVLVLRSNLKDQVRSLADLKGRKVAVNAPSNVLLYMVGKMLESEGLSIKDVEIVYMPWPNMGPAFEKGAIDAGTMVEPFVTQFQERGIAQSFRRAAQVLDKPYLDASVVLYNSDWAAKSPKAAAGFTVAYLRGARHFHDALHGGPARAEVVDLLIRNTRLKEKALYDRMEISIVDPNGRMSKESLRDQQEWHARNGSVPRRANIEEMVDERWVREALARLGSVPERR
jgi:NitT/TauT family transport system substrate-binding protein